jgi:hypothetical protein
VQEASEIGHCPVIEAGPYLSPLVAALGPYDLAFHSGRQPVAGGQHSVKCGPAEKVGDFLPATEEKLNGGHPVDAALLNRRRC